MTPFTTHPELQALIPPSTDEERALLEQSLLAEGCYDCLTVWKEHQILLDGHQRYALCQQHNIVFDVRYVSLPDMDAAKLWMLEYQLGRRNLTPEQASYLRGKQYELAKRGKGRPPANGAKDAPLRTDERLAQEHKVTRRTINYDTAYAKAVDTVAAVAPDVDGARKAILARDTPVDRKDVRVLAAIAKESPQAAKHTLDAVLAAPNRIAKKRVLSEAARAYPKPAKVPRQAQSASTKVSKTSRSTQGAIALPVLTLTPDEVPKSGLEILKAADGREMFIVYNAESRSTFNETNEMVDWARWTWNPVSGCWHDCAYCYARAIANSSSMAKIYPKQFEPTFYPARLHAPANTPYPKVLTCPAEQNVFVCSMADLFGKWVPEDWILQVFERVTVHPEWNFLFLTKFPQRLAQVGEVLGGFPANAWLGCTVDGQARVATAERAFASFDAAVKWLSVEPMNERLTFKALDTFDWLVMGGQTASAYNDTPARQPQWEWVEHLWQQARSAGVKIYWKENLTIRPKEMPWDETGMLVQAARTGVDMPAHDDTRGDTHG